MRTDTAATDAHRADPKDEILRAHDHAWRYFELHANQRLTIFNFFTAAAGLSVAGIAATLQASQRFAAAGIAIGLLLALLSLLFWKLDQRIAFLSKHAERIQTRTEAALFAPEFRIFTSEPEAFDAANRAKSGLKIWTVGHSFRMLFLIAGIFGFVAAAVCGLRFAGVFDWNSKPSEAKELIEGKKNSAAGAAQTEKKLIACPGKSCAADGK